MSLVMIWESAFCEKCNSILYESRYTVSRLIMDSSFKNIWRIPRDNFGQRSHLAQGFAWSLLISKHMKDLSGTITSSMPDTGDMVKCHMHRPILVAVCQQFPQYLV
jgi:hypothetical protein